MEKWNKKILKKVVCLVTAAIMTVPAGIQPVSADITSNTAPTAPIGLLTNSLETPLNIEKTPEFSWLPQDIDRNEIQTAYQIIVTDSITGTEVWDSGKVESSEQSYVKGDDLILAAAHPYKWKVRTWDRYGEESPYSEESEFAAGLTDADWNADWIHTDQTGSNVYWYARTEQNINTEKTISKALAYIACCHDYELNINGIRIGRGQSFDYPDMTSYQAWDITDAVSGHSSVAVGILARWYSEGQGRAKGQMGLMGHIRIYYDDGTYDTITTDGEWKTEATPFYGTTKRNSEGDFVEQYHAALEKTGWTEQGYDDSSWKSAGVIGSHPVTPFTHVLAELGHVTENEIPPVSVTILSDGSAVADFGKVIPARISVHFKNGRLGTQVKIQTGYEIKSDGSINTAKASLQDTDMRFIYDQRDGEQYYHSWDHLAFRYVQIPPLNGETITADDITARIVHAEVPEGRENTFASSNEMLNSVYELMKRSAIYSAQNSFVDTPTREKGQFLNDSINISNVTTTTWYERTTTKKAILQFLNSADRYWNSGDDLGRYNAVYPNGDGKRDIPDFTINVPIWIWDYYRQTGDRELLQMAYTYMKNTADYISRSIPESGATAGLVTKLAGGSSSYQYGIVDWPAAGRFGYDWTNTKEGARTTVNALAVRAFDTVSQIAEALGQSTDAQIYKAKAEALSNAMNEKLITAGGVYCDGLTADGSQVGHAGQHATSYALAFDIAPEEYRKSMSEYVADMGMKQGPMTAHVLIDAMFQTQQNKEALKLLTNEEDSGWAKLIKNGYTFTWESWTDGPADSQSHGWGAAAATEIIEHILGVTVTEAGAKKIKIAPVHDILDSAEGIVWTERGAVETAYSGEGADYTLKVSIPVNVEAEVVLPVIPAIGKGEFVEKNGVDVVSTINEASQIITLGSGVYEFVFDGTPAVSVNISNPEQIAAHAVIQGERYALPVNAKLPVSDMNDIMIVSDDPNYEFAYFSGDIVSANLPVLSTLKKDTLTLSAQFKYVGNLAQKDKVNLSITGTNGRVRVNGIVYDLPHTAVFEQGTELILEPVPERGMIFEGWSNHNLIGTPAIVRINDDIETEIQYQEIGVTALVSLGKPVSALDSLEQGSWGTAKLTDGVKQGSGYSSSSVYDSADVSSLTVKPYVELDLEELMRINRVIIYPRNDDNTKTANQHMFPQDFSIEVSADGIDYVTVKTVTGAADDAEPDIIDFQPVDARYVRVTFTKLCDVYSGLGGTRRLQLAEIEVYSGTADVSLVQDITLNKTEAMVAVNESMEVIAEISPAGADHTNVEWLIHETDGAGFGKVSSKAELITDGNKAVVIPFETGVIEIIARAKDGSGILNRCRVIIDALGSKIKIENASTTEEKLIYDVTVLSEEGTLITALYNHDGALLHIDVDEINGPAEVVKSFDTTDNMTTGVTKFMLWDSIQMMKPISREAAVLWDMEKYDRVWDMTAIFADKTTMDTFPDYVYEYKNLTIKGGGSSDYIDGVDGLHINGKSVPGDDPSRYIKYTAEADGIMELTAKRAYSKGKLYYSTSASLSNGMAVETLSDNASWQTGTVQMTAGTTYYFYCVDSGMKIKQIKFIPAQ